MDGDSHCLVANLALACLPQLERHILYPRWGGIEAGVTLSDHFRIMWEIIEPGSDEKQLVHRCYVDSENPKDHGCITRALDHATGSVGFIQEYISGDMGDTYTEDEFLENLGMFLGVVSHHIADLCTPAHVGHIIDFRSLGFSSLALLHKQVERDINRLLGRVSFTIHRPEAVELRQEYFWGIAQATYNDSFVRLEELYCEREEVALVEMVSRVISAAVKHTVDVWHTIISNSGMAKRKWSMQPLL